MKSNKEKFNSRDVEITFGGERIAPVEVEFVDTEPEISVVEGKVEAFKEVKTDE